MDAGTPPRCGHLNFKMHTDTGVVGLSAPDNTRRAVMPSQQGFDNYMSVAVHGGGLHPELTHERATRRAGPARSSCCC